MSSAPAPAPGRVTPPPTAPASDDAGAAVVPLLMAVSFVCYVNRVSIATAGEARIMDRYGLDPTRMGMVYSAFLLTYTLGMIPGGLFIDRVRPRVALLTVLGVGGVRGPDGPRRPHRPRRRRGLRRAAWWSAA